MAKVQAFRDVYPESDLPTAADQPLLSDLSVDHIEVISEIRPKGQISTTAPGGGSWSSSVAKTSVPGHIVQSIELDVLRDAVPAFNRVGCKTLTWLTCPVVTAEENTALPSISVFSEPEATDELELVVHSNGEGTAQVSGPRQTSLRSQGSLKPSVATFDEVAIKRAGLYVIEIRSVRDHEISIVADHPTEIGFAYASVTHVSEGSNGRVTPLAYQEGMRVRKGFVPVFKSPANWLAQPELGHESTRRDWTGEISAVVRGAVERCGDGFVCFSTD